MSQTVIENPVINSPFTEPGPHFRFTDDGITDEIIEERRSSSYFIPIARPKKKGRQLAFDTDWTQDRTEENRFVNSVHQRVKQWRAGGTSGPQQRLAICSITETMTRESDDCSSAD